MAMFNQDLYLGGKVVGIGKTRKDGSFEYRELENPVHNRIVAKGLDNLLTYNGDDALPDSIYSVSGFLVMGCDWYYGGRWGNGGVMTYSRVGDSDTPTSFHDTELGHPTTEITGNTRRDNPYCGTKAVGDRTIGYRVTHQHNITESGQVKEIGWYKKVKDNYELFSRVVLDFPIDVDAGETLWVTYELDMTFMKTTNVVVPGVVDIDGNPLQAEVTNTRYITNSGDRWTDPSGDTCCPIFVYRDGYSSDFAYTYGYGRYSSSSHRWSQAFTPIWTWHTWEDYYGGAYNGIMAVIGSDAQINYTGNVTTNPVGRPALEFTNQGIRKIHKYRLGSFYRDATITLGASWPSMNTEEYRDISQIIVNSTSYKFGYWDNTDPDNPVWVRQYYRKRRDRVWAITFRQAFHTPDNP